MNRPNDDVAQSTAEGSADSEPSPPAAAPTETGSLEQRFARRTQIRAPVRHNPKLATLLERVNEDVNLYALWVATNVTSVDRLGMTDHGPVHVQIVMNSALRILRLLTAAGVQPAIVRDYGMTNEDAEVVVALASLLHDVGMAIHRDGHEAFSLFVAQPILQSLLAEVYEPPADTVVRSEVLHAIISHRSGGSPLTLEGGILRIADALDMAQGRSRIPFEAGSTSIHSVSAAAIEAVNIEAGKTNPVRITIQMSNSAGVFQVDDLLRKKLAGSGIEEHIEVEAVIEREHEKQLVRRVVL
jgi:metal-dependent HD superfamily phosphatase/phosphodiesterase